MRLTGKPGPGWYFDPDARKWTECTAEERDQARALIERGFVQTSAKYRGVAIIDKTAGWNEIEKAELSPGVFAAFKSMKAVDQEVRLHLEREGRRGRAKRLVHALRILPQASAEELMLDILGADSMFHPEWAYVREAPDSGGRLEIVEDPKTAKAVVSKLEAELAANGETP